ncbi:MAG: phosphoglucomutase [Treponema sp.]|nr:phosphoglucomutase [Treponema sp.]
MILSASGWRKVFAVSGNEQDSSPDITESDWALAVTAANVFFDYVREKSGQDMPVIALGTDSRPTGPALADAMIRALIKKGALIQYSAVTSAPEIMAYARKLDGFIYISASHNPIGHNGIKFGLNDGGVLNAAENKVITDAFLKRLADEDALAADIKLAAGCTTSELQKVYQIKESSKHNALRAYKAFADETISGTNDKEEIESFFKLLDGAIAENPEGIGIVCDFNGSSRYLSIDREYFAAHKIHFHSINEFKIAHEIIPEAENLVYVAAEMEKLHREGYKNVLLGYMPDCDGDRGNIVYWDEKNQKAEILKAQEVFSLSVLAELTFSIWQNGNKPDFKPAVAVNCPTSMRIEEIAGKLGAKVFRAEVGEANVVNLAKEKRAEGYNVRILGEGSNGGTITHPAAVRDPLNTIFAIIKLLFIRENGLYQIWCKKAGIPYKSDFTLNDVLASLPVYSTTGVSEKRAVLKIKTNDHEKLKAAFQKEFEADYEKKKSELQKKYGIYSWEAIITNGTKESRNVKDFSLSKKGGLKVLFKDKNEEALAYIWMRGSGTEPVFRILCDVKGNHKDWEEELLQWESELINKADK